jgi:membrane associated rhomboid family serine protease
MLPIKDTIHSRSFPIVNWLLIGANTLVFLLELTMSPLTLERFIFHYGLVPATINLFNPLTWFPFLTHMFIHSGWFHILSNMWILFIFGDNVEDRMGPWRYLVFYLLGGFASALLQSLMTTDQLVPAIGASGAIAAVLGAYILFYPGARVITIIPLFILPWLVQVPAVIFIGIWFISQLYSGLLSLSSASGASLGGVAWWAHIGGFIFGLALARIFTLGRPVRPQYPDEFNPW